MDRMAGSWDNAFLRSEPTAVHNRRVRTLVQIHVEQPSLIFRGTLIGFVLLLADVVFQVGMRRDT